MALVEILPGISIVDIALYLRRESILIIGDVHLGYEEAMRKQGVFLPRFQFKDTIERLGKIFSSLQQQLKIERLEAVVINGDLKHEFGTVSEQEWREILKLIDFLLGHSKQVILVKGNHDVKLAPVARKRGIVVVEDIAINGKFVSHGHEIPNSSEFEKSKIVIVGDEHPAVSLREGARSELYKCFILGKWKGKKMVVMPSFNQVTIGTDILKEKFISPFMRQDLGNFDVFVVGDKVYHFGKVRTIA